MFESQERAQPLIDQINQLTGIEQVMLWRTLGERLLEAGNSMIKGMPKLETAIYSLMVDALSRPSPRE